jgi:hypothetical protein
VSAVPLADQRPLRDRVLDLVVYAPVGVLRRLREDLPALVESGRREVADRVRVAHWIGEMAVTYGRAELRRISSSTGSSTTSAEIDVTDSEASSPQPFDGYDDLPADRLVQLLSKFPASELAIIRLYEQKQRGRRTVLAKIDQLIDA